MFRRPQVDIHSQDVVRGVEFYRNLGFEETFRTPQEGDPIHVELTLDGFTVGIAAVTSAVAEQGVDLDPSEPGRGIELAAAAADAAASARVAREEGR